MRALILAAALCGCQRYADLAGPVSEPSRDIAGPGECIAALEWPDEYDAADSSATYWTTAEEKAAAQKEAKRRGMTGSQLVRLAVANEINRGGK